MVRDSILKDASLLFECVEGAMWIATKCKKDLEFATEMKDVFTNARSLFINAKHRGE